MPRFPLIFVSVIFGCLCVSSSSYSQDWSELLYSFIDEDSELVSEDGLATLEELTSPKCNLNDLTEYDCQQFFFLTDFERQSLLYYVEHNKPVMSVYELQFVLGLPKEKAMLLAQFCVAEPAREQKSLADLISDGNHSLSSQTTLTNVSNEAYKEQNGYAGGAQKVIIRYRFQSHNELLWGFTLKKDMGEPLSVRNGYDSRSAYVQIRNRGAVSNLVLGDYVVHIGQGLAISQGGFSANSIEQPCASQSYVLSKHSSSSEFAYSRGIGATIKLKQIQITPFLSQRKLDGKIKDDANFPFTIQKTGYHRTESECATKNAIDYALAGVNLQYDIRRLRLQFSALQHKFSKDTVESELRNASVAYNYSKRHFRAYGECAVDKSFRIATVHGVQYSLSDEVQVSSIFRLYQADYQSFFASSVGRQSAIENERGWRFNVKIVAHPRVTVYFDNDLFAMPQERTSVKQPSKGSAFRSKVVYKRNSVTANYQFSHTVQTEKSENGYELRKKQKHIAALAFSPDKSLQLKVSAQLSEQQGDCGWLFYEDMILKMPKRISWSLRFAQFDASYENRLYAWEDDVLYSFSSPQYYYSGTYWYVLCKWKPTEKITLQSKLMQTRYTDKYELPQSYELYADNQKLTAHILIQIAL